MSRVKDAIKSDNIPEIESATEALNQVWQTAASAMYQQASTGANPNPDANMNQGAQSDGGSSSGDSTVDADFEVVDDK